MAVNPDAVETVDPQDSPLPGVCFQIKINQVRPGTFSKLFQNYFLVNGGDSGHEGTE